MKYVIIFLLFSLLSTIPYWTGLIAHQQFPHLQEELTQAMPLTLLDEHYEQGWFHSLVQTTFKLDQPHFDTYTFGLQHTLNHGFMPIQTPDIHTVLSTNIPTCHTDVLRLHTAFDMTGNGTTHFDASPCAIQFGKDTIKWQTLQGEIYFSPDFSAVRGELEGQQLVFKIERMQIAIQTPTLQYKFGQAMPTQLSMTASRFTTNMPFILEQFRFKSQAEHTHDYLTFTVTTHAKQASLHAKSYGPIDLDFSVKHLHFATLQAIYTILQSRSDLQPLEQKFLLMRQIPTLLAHAPQLTVPHLSFNTQAGQVSGNFHIAIAPSKQQTLFNFTELMQTLTVKLACSLPQALLKPLAKLSLEYQGIQPTSETIEQQMQQWLTNGIFVLAEQPNYYHLQLEAKAGRLKINGQEKLWQDVL